jgi:hypothetical protein
MREETGHCHRLDQDRIDCLGLETIGLFERQNPPQCLGTVYARGHQSARCARPIIRGLDLVLCQQYPERICPTEEMTANVLASSLRS